MIINLILILLLYIIGIIIAVYAEWKVKKKVTLFAILSWFCLLLMYFLFLDMVEAYLNEDKECIHSFQLDTGITWVRCEKCGNKYFYHKTPIDIYSKDLKP